MAEHHATYIIIARDDLTDRGEQFTACACKCQLVQSSRNMTQGVLDSVLNSALDSVCR